MGGLTPGIRRILMAIKKCSCNHEYQDEKYGKKLRVFNRKADGKFTCSVCRRETGDAMSPMEIMALKKASEGV